MSFNVCIGFDDSTLHCKFLPHENYGDWELRGPCRENLHYLWKRAVRISGKPHDNYRTYNYHGVSPQFLQPFSIDSADFPYRDPAIPSPRSFHGVKICSVVICPIVEFTSNSKVVHIPLSLAKKNPMVRIKTNLCLSKNYIPVIKSF